MFYQRNVCLHPHKSAKRQQYHLSMLLGLCTLLVALLLLCPNTDAADTKTQQHKEPIKIGAVFGLTGPAQLWAKYARLGAELAQSEINASGGINGRPVEVIFEDSQTNPAQAVTAYKKLVNVDKVSAVIGDVWAFLTNAMIPLTEKDRVVLLSPTVVDSSVDRQRLYFFTMGQKIETLDGAVRRFLEMNPGVKTAVVFCWDDPWGHAYVKLWRRAAEEKGIKILLELCVGDFNHDYKTEVAKTAALKPDMVFIPHYADRILKRMSELNFRPKILSTSDIVEFVIDGTMAPELAEGVYFTDWLPNVAFSKAFAAKFGEAPAVEAHNGYESLQAIAKGLAIDGHDLLRGLRQVSYQGVAGKIDFSSSFSVNYAVGTLMKIEKGKFIKVP